MTRYDTLDYPDGRDDRPTLYDRTPDGTEIREGDYYPTVLDRTPDGREIVAGGPGY